MKGITRIGKRKRSGREVVMGRECMGVLERGKGVEWNERFIEKVRNKGMSGMR